MPYNKATEYRVRHEISSFRYNREVLRDLLQSLPGGSECVFEFRLRSRLPEDAFALLDKHDVSLCCLDTEDGGAWSRLARRFTETAVSEVI